MAKAPAFQFYAADFLTDTADWSNIEVGIYMRLLCHQWINGSIPKAQDRACRVAHNDPIEFGIAWKVVGAKFIDAAEEGKLINQKLESVRKTRQEYVDKQVEFGKQGAKERWKDKVPNKVAHRKPTGVEMPLQSSSSSSTVKQDQELNPPTPLKSPNAPPFDSEDAIDRIYKHYPRLVNEPRSKRAIAIALAELSAQMGGDEEAAVFLETMTQKYRLLVLPFKNIPELWDQVPNPFNWYEAKRYNEDPGEWIPRGARDGQQSSKQADGNRRTRSNYEKVLRELHPDAYADGGSASGADATGDGNRPDQSHPRDLGKIIDAAPIPPLSRGRAAGGS